MVAPSASRPPTGTGNTTYVNAFPRMPIGVNTGVLQPGGSVSSSHGGRTKRARLE